MKKYSTDNKKDLAASAYDIKVNDAKIIDNGVINFNATVNGINIYGMKHITYTNKEGKEGTMISFPSWKSNRKDENGKDIYIPYVTFRIDQDLKKNIEDQLEAILG